MAGYKAYIGNQKITSGDNITLSQEESRHLIGSLRADLNSKLLIFNNLGSSWLAQLIQNNKSNAIVKVLKQHPLPSEKAHITLAQALTKGKSFENIIQKSIEIGVSEIIPLITEHTEVKLLGDREQKRLEKWHSIAVEACKQSGNLRLPAISRPCKYRDYIDSAPKEALKLVASLQDGSRPLKDVFKPNGVIHWLIGPEGDFSREEYRLAEEAGFQATRLGIHVLKSSTAATYALSATDALL